MPVLMNGRGRVLIVANRLPITVEHHKGRVTLASSPGGLANGLTRIYEQSGGKWIGWTGDAGRLRNTEREAIDRELAERSLVAVHLTAQEVKLYYETFANGVIWPLFHYLLDRMPLDPSGWDQYAHVNERFADAVVSAYTPGDLVWVHDYQLMLLPGLLRRRLPDARIGFFLHIPFPSAEVFRTLPWRTAVLEGMLGADVVGFHTAAYVRHFATSLRHLLGIEADLDRAQFEGREVRLDAFPMGIDVGAFEQLAGRSDVMAEAERVRADSGGRTILLGVDRLDYTKGIPRRLLAFERVLEQQPALRDRVRLIQVAVPTRTGIEHYQHFRRHLDELIGRSNGAYGTMTSMPVHYLYRSIPPEQLTALYRAANVMLVTPLRDGMNLVAKEFVASRLDDDGVLVLSELAGAAAELGEALLVNPYDVDGMAGAIVRAIEMPRREQRTRMRALRGRVRDYDVHRWTTLFLERLEVPPAPLRLTSPPDIDALMRRLVRAPKLTLLLDYDGTVVPIVSGPALAAPDDALLEQLSELAGTPDIDVHVVSGRARETLENWLGTLPIGLWAEHGLWYRPRPSGQWESMVPAQREWMDRVRPIILRSIHATPGSLVEEKTASFAWHYRMADPDLGERHARVLRAALTNVLSDAPVEILDGSKVVEVRLRNVSKGLVVAHLASSAGTLVAVGDDRTDEDMFTALPSSGVAIHVGPLSSTAQYRLRDWRAVRDLLSSLATGRRALATPAHGLAR
jgi:trehalose 6-phosphate synthase/phosphatase